MMKTLALTLIATAALLAAANPAAAATRTLSGSLTDSSGQEDLGTITLTVTTRRGVARRVSAIKLRNVQSFCVDGKQDVPGELVDANLRGRFGVSRRRESGRLGYRFTGNDVKGGDFRWNIAGRLNKKGTRVLDGNLEAPDLGKDGECRFEGSWTAER